MLSKTRILRPARLFSTRLPDFNTPVEVDQIKLAKPKRPGSWVSRPQDTTGSLIPDTLARMEEDEDFQLSLRNLKELGQQRLTMEERKRRRRALDDLGVPNFVDFIEQQGLNVTRKSSQIFQLNIGLYCNQACNHCHVESSPQRTEMMDRKVADRCLEVLNNSPSITTLDLTGGAPELNSQFRYLVESVSSRPIEIIDRCNLTVLMEPGQEDLVDFLAQHRVRVVASLPCYSKKNVNMQRGNKVFERSIEGLRKLNAAGYGVEGTGLNLDLVYNPLGAFLPPPQEALEGKYKEELMEAFGISFNDLFTITNMPIKRFADFLYRRGELKEYMDLLVRNFNSDTTENVMCTNTVSVGWDGQIYDCDFNQQLAMPVCKEKNSVSIFDIESVDDLPRRIVLDSHCFGCTSGMGSSCQGETA